jgi:hypothetical protein
MGEEKAAVGEMPHRSRPLAGDCNRERRGHGPVGIMKKAVRLTSILFLILSARPGRAQLEPFAGSLDDEAIQYQRGSLTDPVALLQQRIDRGEAQLEFSEKLGYLPSMLKALGVPVSSQMLVFSKTSFQMKRISPERPRAIYFNDNVYVGFVQRSDLLELSSIDPHKGAIFYTLSQRRADKPKFVRRLDDCLQCHVSVNTMQVPGNLVRSVYPDSTGEPLLEAGSFLTDHRSPLSQRWGGWYVTGTHGAQRHMGNVVAKNARRPEWLDTAAGANVTDLKGHVNTAPYPSPHSDLVALMVLEHQTRLHTLITRVGYQARAARPGSTEWIERSVDVLLRYLLFADEAKLTEPVQGTSNFREEFETLGPKDHQGRSLRQMDLARRMFKYPCSFLIYSEAFDELPAMVKEPLYRRLWEVLSGQDQSEGFAALSAADRLAVLEILIDTKPGLPGYFRGATRAATLP